jgi:pimeloyl-ACP methyl ester carboxylesterase
VQQLLRFLTVCVLLLIAAGAALFFVGVPALERRMTFHADKYDPQRPWQLPPDTADVFFPAADGVRLHGWFYTATAPRNGATVLLLHGNGGDLTGVKGDALYLQKHGFDVLAIDYRGYGKSEGEPRDEATLKLDGDAAMRHFTAGRGVDAATVALLGESLGTTVAAEIAVSWPCRAVTLIAPLASARQQAADVLPYVPSFLYRAMHNQFDTVGKIGQAHCPVLIVHGEKDTTIAFHQGRAVYEAARSPKKFIDVPQGGHWLPLADDTDYTKTVVDLFATGRLD